MSRRGLPLSVTVRKFISRFPGLKYDGKTVICTYCNISLVCWNSNHCQQHVRTQRHVANKTRNVPRWKFLYDFIFMLSACNIPHNIVDRGPFRAFWEKYVRTWKLLTRRQLQYQLPRVKELVTTNIKTKLQSQKIWLTISESRNYKNHKVINILARILRSDGISLPFLLSSQPLKNDKPESIAKRVTEVLHKFGIYHNQVLIFVTSGASDMLQTGILLKPSFPIVLHITCLVDALVTVIEGIQNGYPDVDSLISQTQAFFSKSTKRIQDFKKAYSGIPSFPELEKTKWGSWLEAVFYYNTYFDEISRFFLGYTESKGYTAIRNIQEKLNDPQVKSDFTVISENYTVVAESLKALQKKSLSLAESLSIIYNLESSLDQLTDSVGLWTAELFRELILSNPDYKNLETISQSISEPEQSDIIANQCYKFVRITSSDTARLLSKHAVTFAGLRNRMSESTKEGFLMIQVYAKTVNRSLTSRRGGEAQL